MTDESLALLLAAPDPFAFAVEHPELYRLATNPKAIESYVAPAIDQLGERDRGSFELGVLYVSRRYTSLTAAQLGERVSAILSRNRNDLWIQRRVRLTEAAILLSVVSDFELAESAFEECIASSRLSDDHFAYGLACKGLGDTRLSRGWVAGAEEAYENSLAAFRRLGCQVCVAFVHNNLGVVRMRCGEFDTGARLLRKARVLFARLDMPMNLIDASKNLGNLCVFQGEWKAARGWYDSAVRIQDNVMRSFAGSVPSEARWTCATLVEGLLVVQRRFREAEPGLLRTMHEAEEYPMPARIVALVHEVLGELYTESQRYALAEEQLKADFAIIAAKAPDGEGMTEVLRRQAQLQLCVGDLETARGTALRCIRLCKQIGDRYELGAATRVLGEVYAAEGNVLRAAACFRSAIRTLKGIHECYELMRALYAQGRFLSSQGNREEAEIALLEGRQLSKKLELDYYQTLIAIALIDLLGPQERFDEANSWLNEATALRDTLEGVDRDRVEAELKRSANGLQTAITRASVKSAETLKTICRVYEDARFPIAEIKPDLAYQVAQSVGGESLWVIARRGGGYHVPITYNISTNDAKNVVRGLDDTKKKGLLGVEDEPTVMATKAGQTLVVTPCRDMDGRSNGYVTCTRFETIVSITPRQVEILCASADALSRLIEDDDERKPAAGSDGDEEPARARHPRGSFKEILTIDPEMIKLIRLAERAATSVAPILLEGETGVGKELFARAIHGASQRKDGPFVAVNAGGMPVSLLESELFGHVKGAFTDARSERMGLVEMAREGSLFLDEVGEMSEELQVKLLRLLENGEYRRLGESTTRKADVRVISATNRDLKFEAEHGRFRRDLYYRLTPVKLTVPPLRMRTRDIQLMVRHFLRECAAMNGIADRFIEIDVKAMEALELYDWPGNVRELHNEILRVVSLIGKGDLVRFPMLSDSVKDYLQTKKRGDGLLERSVEQYERRLILRALDNNEWNRMKTADSIGIPRTTLLAKLKRLNVASK